MRAFYDGKRSCGVVASRAVDRLLRHLRKCIKQAGIDPRGIDLHALRYSFGSWLVREGVNIKLVSRLLGHATVQLTLDIYTDAGIMDWRGAVSKLPPLGPESRANGGTTGTASAPHVQVKAG